MTARRMVLAALLAAAATAAVAAAPMAEAATPVVVRGSGAGVHPESVSWDAAHHRFVVSGLRHGTVSTVGPDGVAHTLVDDPSVLVSVTGIKVDDARNRVLVCDADPGVGVRSGPATVKQLAGLGSYDLRTGKRLWYVDLAAVAADGGPHFANDVVFDQDGTAYVTDSFAPIVYRVTADGHASVFVRDDRLAAPQGQFGLNGIVLTGGRLVLGNYATGSVWEVPVNHPTDVREVVSDPRLTGLDGLVADGRGQIEGVTNTLGGGGADQVVRLRSGDGWHTASVVVRPSADPGPTGVTRGPGGAVFTLSGELGPLFATGTTSDAFTLRRV
ncbi:hypothetical protein OG455_30335 [Kitasatospora sp. NBC_01287]|uniref:hypothetical protein n=1 Tax=Kitasatospora sp. NBC_01287 TaxID=2903573 RepID=UPI00224EE393|nr:hypothetical protein [Kitasatospora sp. NBC_01287]MCX4749762.1 hypothetical protein [Kitasatospora sp. NBC_01287]